MQIDFLTLVTGDIGAFDPEKENKKEIDRIKKLLISEIKKGKSILSYPIASENYQLKFSLAGSILLCIVSIFGGEHDAAPILSFMIASDEIDLIDMWPVFTSEKMNMGLDMSAVPKPSVPCIVTALHEGGLYRPLQLPYFANFQRLFAAAWFLDRD